MKVKVGDKIYDAEKEPIMVILSDLDKMYISNMNPDNMRYCCYPDHGYSVESISKWMKEMGKQK